LHTTTPTIVPAPSSDRDESDSKRVLRLAGGIGLQAAMVVALVHLALLVPYREGWLTAPAFALSAAALSGIAVATLAFPLARVLYNLREGLMRFWAGAEDRPLTLIARPLSNLDAELERLHARVLKRVDDLKAASRAVHRESRAQRRIAKHLTHAQRIAHVGSWEWHLPTHRVLCSNEVYRILGLEPGAFTPTPSALVNLVHRDDRRALRRWIVRIAHGASPEGLDVRVYAAGGALLNVHVLGEASRGPRGRTTAVVGTVQDATERTRAIQQIHQLAYYDVLTELPNRLRFHEKLAETLEFARRHAQTFAIMFLDLDQFKRINDTMGHAVGDDLLRVVAQRLTRVLRLDPAATSIAGKSPDRDVCRQGGDEFIVLLNGVSTEEQAARAAHRVVETLAQPIRLGGQELFVSASIGIVLYPRDGADLDTLLKNADVAMYHAKGEGRNRHVFYRDSMRQATAARLSLEHDLRRAIEDEQFELHYQPQINVATGELAGIEALIRWNHPTLGMLLPQHFIPVAEEAGLIMAIWEWVFVTALIQHNAWVADGLPPLTIGVNLSSLQFGDLGLADRVREITKVIGVSPRYVELEVTESALVRDFEGARATLNTLREMGAKIAIDDFGTGYSSLSCLRRLALDKLKLDHSFTTDAVQSDEGAAIARAIIAMAESLRLTVVAEGVETQAQIDFLSALGCNTMQGYLLSRPLPAAVMTEMLRSRYPHGTSGRAPLSGFDWPLPQSSSRH
jgi:diguanylate cyclase (GGDEF)-like protein